MFFQSKIRVDADSTEQVSLAYVEEYWEYAKNRHCSMVGSGNVQLYAPGRQELSTAAGDVQVCLGLVREMADLDVDVSVGGGDPDAIETVLQDLTADDGEHAAATDLSPGLAAAATEFDDNQSAFGGPEAGFLEGLVEGIEEHPDLSRLLTPMGLFRTCPHGRCSRGGNCLLRMATLRHEWLVQQVREADRLQTATRAPDMHNLGRGTEVAR